MGLGGDAAAREAELALGRSSLVQGVVESIDWPNKLARVNVSGGSLPMPMLWNAPLVGMKVWVAYLGQQPICLGPVARAGLGTVQGTPSGGYAVVLGDDAVSYTVPYLGAAPSNGNRVAILWGEGGVVPSGVLSAEPVGTVPVVPANATATTKKFTFYPTDSGNWSGSGYNSIADPFCSASVIGAYFYGNTIPNSIPDSATFVDGSLQIYLAEFYNQYPSSKATLGLHNRSSKSGDPTPTSEITIRNLYPDGGWVDLPDSWEDNFRLGTHRGVSFGHGGYHKYRRAGQGNSGVIAGKWRV